MKELVLQGGFGSSPEQMRSLSRIIGKYIGCRAVGVCYREANQRLDEYADLIEGKTVLTHSGGLQPVWKAIEQYQAEPKQLIALAPPFPEQVRHLLWRGALIGLSTSEAQEQFEEKVCNNTELLRHPMANFGRIRSLGQFDSIEKLIQLKERGIETITLALMERDGLFDYTSSRVREQIDNATETGVKVVAVPGTHCRLSDEPLAVIEAINSNIPFNSTLEPKSQRARIPMPRSHVAMVC